MVITQHGLAFTKVQLGDTVVAFNPISKEHDAKAAKFGANIALISMNDERFNGRDQVSYGSKEAFVIDTPGEYEIGGVFIQGFPSEGAKGKINTVFTLNMENMRLLHLGALATSTLTPETIEEIGVIDIVFVPVGGDDVLNPKEAAKLASSFEPKIIIPTMYEGKKGEENLALFIKEAGKGVEKPIDKLAIKRKDIEGKVAEVVIINS
jgi:hypothetical protein